MSIQAFLVDMGVTGLLTACGFVVRVAIKGNKVIETVQDTHQLLQTATTNHLAHIESGVKDLGEKFDGLGTKIDGLSETMKDGFGRMESAINRAADAQREDMRELRTKRTRK